MSAPCRALTAAVVPILLAGAIGHADPHRVRGVVLPTRRQDAAQLRQRAQRIAQLLQRRLFGASTPAAADSPLDLSPQLGPARALVLSGSFDLAAEMLDAALARGARAPHRLLDPGAFVAAHLMRISVALARGETRRARELVERVLRYDPTATPRPDEENPRLLELFRSEARRLAGAPARSQDLGEACQTADVVVVLRTDRWGDLELARFDKCGLVTRTQTPPGTSDEAAVAMLGGPLDPPGGTAATTSPPPGGRARRLAGPIGLGVGGLLVLGTGGLLAGLARRSFDDLATSPCGLAGTCPDSLYSGPRDRQNAGFALIGIGGAAVTAAIIWGVVVHARARAAGRPAR